MSERSFSFNHKATPRVASSNAEFSESRSGILIPIDFIAQAQSAQSVVQARDRIIDFASSIGLIDGDIADMLSTSTLDVCVNCLRRLLKMLVLEVEDRRSIDDMLMLRAEVNFVVTEESVEQVKGCSALLSKSRRQLRDAIHELDSEGEEDQAAREDSHDNQEALHLERLSFLHDAAAKGQVDPPRGAEGSKSDPSELVKKWYIDDYLPPSDCYQRVFDKEMLTQISKAAAGLTDCLPRLSSFIGNAIAHSGFRLRASLGLETIDRLDSLRTDFPNFSEVLDAVSDEVWLNIYRQPTRRFFNPILITGPAGVGKTTLAEAIARAMGFAVQLIDSGQLTAGFVLAGADPSWSTAKPGLLALEIARSPVVDRIVVVDELDKLREDERYPVLPLLLQMMEPQTSRRFKDQFLGVEFDLTKTFFLATANDRFAIPHMLRSRFNVITVQSPSETQRRAIVQSVLKHSFPEFDLDEQLIEQLARDLVDLRQLRRILMRVFAVAARRSQRLSDAPSGRLTATVWDAKVSGVLR